MHKYCLDYFFKNCSKAFIKLMIDTLEQNQKSNSINEFISIKQNDSIDKVANNKLEEEEL